MIRCFAKKESLHESCRKGRRFDANSLICSLGHCACDGHRVHKLSQRRLTADWLAPLERDCSRMRSKISSDWLSSYIKVTLSVLETFKMVGYFPDWPHMSRILRRHEIWAEYKMIWKVDACCREHGHKLPNSMNVVNIFAKWMTFRFERVSLIHWISYLVFLANLRWQAIM